MAAIARLTLDFAPSDPRGASPWQAFAQQVSAWAAREAISLRDAVVLLPFAQLLPLARQAFGQAGGWQPRIETTRTLAVSLGPTPPAQAMQITGDVAADRLTAARLLRSQAPGLAWSRQDPRRFERAVAALVQTAQALAQAAAAVPPGGRARYWEAARALLSPLPGPGAQQRWLARVALEWAAQAGASSTDRLFETRPSAWIALQAGGPDPLVQSLLTAAPEALPCLVIDADTCALPAGDVDPPRFARCDGFEHEAQCAAAQVLVHLERGDVPVALIGLDRQLVRRVRALLERQQVPLADETGWALSTTRAAALLMSMLRAAPVRAGTDALFDWLKSLPGWPGREDAPQRLRDLERFCRKRALSRIAMLDRVELEAALAGFWPAVRAVLEPLRIERLSVSDWLPRLREALQASGAWSELEADEAGRAVLAALRLSPGTVADDAWLDAAGASVLSPQGLVSWVDAVLEQAVFTPTGPQADAAQVVITPLARAMLRPFGAVVCAGADDRHLGAPAAPHPLLSDADQEALGLGGRGLWQQRQTLAFRQLARLPHVTLLRRRVQADGEPLADSPLLQRLALDLAAQGRSLSAWVDPRATRTLPASPLARPLPRAADRLPGRVSASAVEALRDCPYRFFSRHVLALREDDELEAELEKRDYGSWLHAVLLRFHAGREAPGGGDVDSARLHEIARDVQSAMGLPDDEFLPFAASFERFVPRYLDWLHGRDAAGEQWQSGEREFRIRPEGFGGIELQGVIDRIDRVDHGAALQLIDYKTVAPDKLKRKLAEPLEDSQLAFYAALLAPEAELPLQACYLPLDHGDRITELPHADVQRSAAVLLRELGSEFARLRAGAPLPALGEGATCEHCEARGLCRRDHWPDEGAA
jgi:ATP-dependent helicase/nuclease subunit B